MEDLGCESGEKNSHGIFIRMTLHTCLPPEDVLKKWLKKYPSEREGYGHLLLEEKDPKPEGLALGLRPYFESAHLDARKYIHDAIGIDLHPDGEGGGAVLYPGSLPETAKRGLFGEVMAGLVVQAYSLIGKHKWRVPAFLFRCHEDAEKYLFTLKRDAEQARAVFGRFGSDFVGLRLDGDDEVAGVIAGEAKWRKTLSQSVVDQLLLGPLETDADTDEKVHNSKKGIWAELNKDVNPPHGITQLRRILREIDPDGHDKIILGLDRMIAGDGGEKVPRTDLVLLVGNGTKKREKATCLVDWEKLPEGYEVEIFLSDGESLIAEIYQALWAEEGEDAGA